MNSSQRRKYGKQVEKINRRLEDKFLPATRKAIKAKIDRVIASLREGGVSEAMRFLSTDMGNIELGQVIRDLYRTVAIRHAKRVNNELRNQPMQLKYISGRLGYSEAWISFINQYLEANLFEKVVIMINATTRARLLAAIQLGVSEGLGVDDITRLIEDAEIYRWQAARIVRTEVNRAANVGAMAAGSTFQFEQQKEWISIMDSRTRGRDPNDHASHVALDGQMREEDGVWIDPRNGDELRFPGDPNASAASVINCRCTLAFEAKRDENGRLIPKRQQQRITVIRPGEFVRTGRVVTV